MRLLIACSQCDVRPMLDPALTAGWPDLTVAWVSRPDAVSRTLDELAFDGVVADPLSLVGAEALRRARENHPEIARLAFDAPHAEAASAHVRLPRDATLRLIAESIAELRCRVSPTARRPRQRPRTPTPVCVARPA